MVFGLGRWNSLFRRKNSQSAEIIPCSVEEGLAWKPLNLLVSQLSRFRKAGGFNEDPVNLAVSKEFGGGDGFRPQLRPPPTVQGPCGRKDVIEH
jgi:hypothetical protein